MSLGVDGLVAIASNMCHKFPKALVGAFKRYKYGQVDLKLGIIMASFAVLGVIVGIEIQQKINTTFGNLGSENSNPGACASSTKGFPKEYGLLKINDEIITCLLYTSPSPRD